MNRFKLLYFVIFIINLYKINAQISDKRLCVDEECKVPISLAKTLLRYSSPDSRILSFAPNVDITIYSKSAGSREDLWGGEINGKRGYVPKHMVREMKVLQKPTLLVDTEFNNDTETKQVPSQVEPDKVQQPYEVVDGTTIYLTPQDDINPTSTDSPIQSTALPLETVSESDIVLSEQVPLKDTLTDTVINPLKDQNESIKKFVENTVNSPTVEEGGEGIVTNSLGNSKHQETVESQINVGEKKEMLPNQETSDSDDDDDDEKDLEEEDAEIDIDDEDEEEENEEQDIIDNLDLDLTTQETEESKLEAVLEIKEFSENKLADDVLVNNVKNQNVKDVLETNTKITKEDKVETLIVEAGGNSLNVPLEENVGANVESKVTIGTLGGSLLDVETESVLSELLTSTEESLNIGNTTAEVVEAVSQTELDNKQDETVKIESAINAKETVLQNIKVEKNENLNVASVANNEVKDEKITNEPLITETIHNIEATTISAEIEVPQPFDDIFTEVTSNPLERVIEDTQNVKNTVPTLPPLSLFGTSNPAAVNSFKNVDDTVKEENEESSNIEPSINKEEIDINKLIETTSVKETVEENDDFSEDKKQIDEVDVDENGNSGFFSGIVSLFGLDFEKTEDGKHTGKEEFEHTHMVDLEKQHMTGDDFISTDNKEQCDATSCQKSELNEVPAETSGMDLFNFNSDILLYLVTTAISVIIFLFGYIAFDKNKREGPLIAKINKLEKELLIILKENEILQGKISTDSGFETNDPVSNEVVENLKSDLLEMIDVKNALEEQVQSLEKELENSTEVGMELNRMLTEILSSESGRDVIKANVEHLQRQLVEQQSTITSVNETLAVTNTENHELRLELDLSNKKVLDLQAELDKLLLNVLKIEEEKETQQSSLESEMSACRQKYEEMISKLKAKEEECGTELKQLKNSLDQTQRKLEFKIKEHDLITDSVRQLKVIKSKDDSIVQNLLEVSGIKAELQMVKTENQRLSEKLQQEQEMKLGFEKRAQVVNDEIHLLREKYDEADKLRVETQTKLEVLSNYFKDREAQWQKEISKHEALWAEKQGEATSTTERIKFMQEQLHNYKTQTESLKQEIMSQEIELKSQISVLEKKAHENWVSARQAERKLEETKQEAAQLRHRLTLRERAIQEDKNQHRLQSPIEQNGDMPISPLESPASPPLLYGTRDHITKSPPIPGLPPFMPPPPGVPFMPPPLHGVPPFIPPPPPNMFPGDHRPPPLGRMSSPPLNSRYSPSSRGYSPYDRNSSSPSDSEYGTSPPRRRGYSPFNNRDEERRDYKRPPPGRSNGRNIMKGGGSSGSGHSNESLEKINRQQSKV
jgi:hypothetical protein